MCENNNIDIDSLLVEIIRNGNFPDESFGEEHIKRISNKIRINSNKVSFSIIRHPHLFGHESKGKQSSAFANKKITYEIDTKTKQVEYIDEEILNIKIDYDALANEEIPDTVDGWLRDRRRNLSHIKTKEKVIEFAGKGFENMNWLASYEAAIEEYNISNDCVEKILKALKNSFISEILSEWEYKKELREHKRGCESEEKNNYRNKKRKGAQ